MLIFQVAAIIKINVAQVSSAAHVSQVDFAIFSLSSKKAQNFVIPPLLQRVRGDHLTTISRMSRERMTPWSDLCCRPPLRKRSSSWLRSSPPAMFAFAVFMFSLHLHHVHRFRLENYTVKKGERGLPFPARMSLTKLHLGRNN
jgi:hypothetical protein